MTFLELKRRLVASGVADPDHAWTQFQRATGSRDPDLFLGWLRERMLISSGVFVELSTAGAIELTRLLSGPAEATFVAPEAGEVAGSPHTTTGPGVAAALGGEAAARAHGERQLALLGVLGRGAMGEVLVAKDLELRRKVALKRMVPEVASNERLASRFFEEVQVTAQLDHPNIVPIYGLEVGEGGALGYSMKLVQGRTLTELLDEAIATAPRRSAAEEADRVARHVEIFLKVCDGIAYAHAKGVLHRDLKPDNIMVGRYNEVYVMDWGICRLIGVADAEADSLVSITSAGAPAGAPDGTPGAEVAGEDAAHQRTQLGQVLGTPSYLSPEQALGRNPELDGRSDLYTLGLILQEIVTLRRAMQAPNLVALLARAAQAEREPVAHLDGRFGIARELKAILGRACARDKSARYASVADLAEDVRRWQRGESVLAEPDNALQAMLRWMGQHRGLTATALLVLLLAGAGGTAAVLYRADRQLVHAQHHEEALGTLLGSVSRQGHAIDNHLHRYEAALEALGGHALEALRDPDDPSRPWYSTEALDTGRGPADTAPSAYYGAPVSLAHPTIKLAPGLRAEAEEVRHEIAALSGLGPAFRGMMLASAGEQPEQVDAARARELITVAGVPVLRAFVTLADGVHAVYPGLGGFPPEYDGRHRPKYKLAEKQHGMRWGNPYPDRYGHGLLLPLSTGLYDDDGRFVGVAGFDMTFQFLIDNLLDLPGPRTVVETLLVDDQARVVVRFVPGRRGKGPYGDARDALDKAGGDEAVPLQPIAWAEVAREMRAGRDGHVERTAERRVIAWSHLDATGWWYVVVADAERLFPTTTRAADRAAVLESLRGANE